MAGGVPAKTNSPNNLINQMDARRNDYQANIAPFEKGNKNAPNLISS